jgi:hypothetical protein
LAIPAGLEPATARLEGGGVFARIQRLAVNGERSGSFGFNALQWRRKTGKSARIRRRYISRKAVVISAIERMRKRAKPSH